jgi:predicted MPP superfamily phosphohydrolase
VSEERPRGPVPSPARRRFLRGALLIAATVAVAGVSGTAVRSAYRHRIVRVQATLPRLRAPLRVAFLCDLHHGPWIRTEQVRAWITDAVEAAPDLIVFGGDLVDHRQGPEPVDALLDAFRRARAPLGTFAVWGNHDHARFGGLAPFARRLAAAGVEVLENRGVEVRGDLWLAGVDDVNQGRPDLAAALRGRPDAAACLLASHNPDLLPDVPAGEVGLTLCGHTHGGQVVLPLVGALATGSVHGQRFLAGWVEGPARGYVSRGLGVGYLPLRWNCPAELTILDLTPA